MVAWVAGVLGKPGFSKLVKFFRVKSIENSVEEAGEVFHPLKKQKKTIFFNVSHRVARVPIFEVVSSVIRECAAPKRHSSVGFRVRFLFYGPTFGRKKNKDRNRVD